jgi:signal transduction histidine kinase
VDLAAVGRAAADLAAPGLAAARLEFQVQLAPSLPVLADPDGLKQVIGNLLQNALRYTPAPGHVLLRGERVLGGQRDGMVRVEVSNSGPGIPAADLPHVFERFYRVEKSRDAALGGAGIGLAIVRELVTSFGGRVGVESANGRTTVWFHLPAATPARVVGPPKAAARSGMN